jgi:hypothetical protein
VFLFGREEVYITFRKRLKGEILCFPACCKVLLLPEHKSSMKWERKGRECEEAHVYLISVVGDILRDLHFYLVIIATQWNRFFIILPNLKKERERERMREREKDSRLREANKFAQDHITDNWIKRSQVK